MTATRRIMRKFKGIILRRMPLMITCRDFEDFIAEYDDGGLRPAQRFVFELHLKVCAECRSYLAAYRHATALGRSAFDDPDGALPDDVPEDLVTAILAARNSEDAEGPGNNDAPA